MAKAPSAKREKASRDPLKLNITSMMDMFTIILVFLLKSYSASPEAAVSLSSEITLPSSSSDKPPIAAVSVVVTQKQVLIDDSGRVTVVAEIEETSPLFQPLRQSGFSVYARQRVWDLSEISLRQDLEAYWRRSKDVDRIAIQNLQRQIVPPLLQQVESFGNHRRGVVCRNDELLAYVDTIYGGRGIFLRPLIHPNTDKIHEKLVSLLSRNLANRRQRPVYFCVRSYQAWVEPILEDMEASVGPRQVVMVKHLAGTQRTEKTVPRGTDTAWANPAAPIQSSKIKGKKTL